jgi:hypothetical protein
MHHVKYYGISIDLCPIIYVINMHGNVGNAALLL